MTLRDKLKFWILLSNYIQMVVRGTSPLSLPDALDDKLLDLKAYGDCETRNLPEGYQELEYIEGNSANQYINTGIVPTSSMEYYAKCAVLERISNSFPVFGARASNGGNDGIGVFVGSGTNTRIDSFFFTATGTEYRWQLNNVNTYGDIYEITFKNALQEVIKNGTSIGTKQYTPTSTCDKPLYVGSLNNGGALQAGEWTYRFYRFTITGIADMRPARRLSDGAVGMYDTIRKRFFTNAGTGSFIAGAALTLPEGYTRIEYIEGHNNAQYINTGIVPTSSMSMYFKGQFISVDSSTPTQVAFLAGARDVGGQYGFFLQLASTNVGLDWFVVNGRWTANNTRAVGDVVEMKVSNSLAEIWINGTSVGTHQYTPNDTTQYPLFLNGLNSVGQPFDTNVNVVNRIYRFTIDGVADFVPARRDSDGAIGMFNVLNNQFYGNAGTGTFTAGGVVAPTPTAPQDIWCNNGAIKAIRPIKYLESTGTQYIDTGVVPNQDTRVELDGQMISTTAAAFFGVRTDATTAVYAIQRYSSGKIAMGYNDSFGLTDVDADTNRHVWYKNKNLQYIDGNLAFTANYSNFTAMGTAILFGFNNNGSKASSVSLRVYSCKIWDGDTLVRDMIPALDANNIPCMFDKVEGKCYYNAGTGQFIAGYLPAEYEELEYIQSSGSEYINTGITVNQNTEIETEFQRTDLSVAGYMYGVSRSGNTGVCTAYFNTTSSVAWRFSSDTVNPADNGFLDTNWHHTIQNKNGVTADGVLKAYTSIADFTTDVQLPLFRGYNASTSSYANGAAVRIKRFQIRQSGASVADMIPARKRSNGHIGMYDLVRRQFFENAGEGQFTIGKLPVLPDTYTRLEYLESTGTQYINTGVVPNQDTSVELDGSIDGYGIFFGVRTSTTEGVSTIQGLSSGTWAMGYNNSSVAFGTKDSNRHVWFKNKNLQYMDGELKYNYTYANFTAMGNAYLFAYNNNGTVGYVINGRVKIYSCKIWATADSMLVRYMIPAKRNSDGVVGMYDIMNDVFLTNQGTGDFEYGAEIPDSRESYYCVDGVVEKVGTHSTSNKNLFNGVFEQGGFYQGNLVVSDARIRTPDYLTFPAGTYTISCASAYELIFQINGVSENAWYQDKTLTLSSTDKLMICARNKANPSGDILPTEPVNVQIEAGSTATAYVPYCDGGLAVCENLLGIDSTQDIQEILTGEVTRKVGVFVLTGEEWWEKLNFADKSVFRTKVVIPDDRYSNPENNIGLCSHFTVIPTSASVTSLMNNLELAWNTNSLMCIRYDSMANLTDFLAFLRSQYDAGTPVTIVYPLATASTESVAGQTLTVSAGNNTAEIIQASIEGLEIEAKYLKVG